MRSVRKGWDFHLEGLHVWGVSLDTTWGLVRLVPVLEYRGFRRILLGPRVTMEVFTFRSIKSGWVGVLFSGAECAPACAKAY